MAKYKNSKNHIISQEERYYINKMREIKKSLMVKHQLPEKIFSGLESEIILNSEGKFRGWSVGEASIFRETFNG